MSIAREIVERVFFPNRDPHAIPVLDGGFSPNTRLDDAEDVAEIDTPDALAVGGDGAVFVSSGCEILRFGNRDFSQPEQFAAFEHPVGALAFGNGRLYVALAGQGVVALDDSGQEVKRLEIVGRERLGCVTAIAVGGDGSVFVADGSRGNDAGNWLKDLMEKRPGSGRIIGCSGDLDAANVLCDGLSWPAGIAADGEMLLVTEAWAHRLLSIPRKGGMARVVVKNFAGYPSRIQPASAGGHWVSFFAVRTQLTEFVLREDAFRKLMMERIDRNLWIGPSLGDHFDYREPTQVGRIKKLGIQKPWAPPRSYGLVARVNEAGEAIESLHSRVSGETHGITDLAESAGRLWMISKGHRKLVSVAVDRGPAASARGVS
ncbi:hypothetical protein U5922_001340 [Aquicoccus sp. G2-2]|uniref:hypothetical protein n=1 Tax=Aquicoccus sp. G2-2 TaxID=3092120 RepID=UPI002ADF362A|nr:hypothetical protein [Aquicoccus sp. G2-2]MEA1112174.1 hypothetical protein [Aquicoccus sp. G2-2]